MSFEETISNKMSVRALVYHLSNYVGLFIRPRNTWRRAINDKIEDNDFIALHLIYYALFSFCLAWYFKVAIILGIIEVIGTTWPWLALILPFRLFAGKLKLPIDSRGLIKLLLIIKLQCAPFLAVVLVLAHHTQLDVYYSLFDNLIWFVPILSILAMPLILNLKVYARILWILANYSCWMISFFIVGMLLGETTVPKWLSSKSPVLEYVQFKREAQGFRNKIDDTYFVALAIEKKEEPDQSYVLISQYASHDLVSGFLKTSVNQTHRFLLENDTSKKLKARLSLYKTEDELSLKKFILIEHDLDSLYTNDFGAIRRLKDSSNFDSNRKYFVTLHEYFVSYKKGFADNSILAKTKNDIKPLSSIQFSDSVYCFIYSDSLRFKDVNHDLKMQEELLERRERVSSILPDILLSPIIKVASWLNTSD